MADLAKQLKLPSQRVHIHNASFLKRLLAFIVDIIIMDFVIFSSFDALLLLKKPELSSILNGSTQVSSSLYATGVLLMLIAFCYFVLFEYLLSQTPGMMLLSIEVENVTLWKAFVRNLYLIPLFPFPILWIMEPIYLLLRKRRFLESITGTRTIQRINY